MGSREKKSKKELERTPTNMQARLAAGIDVEAIEEMQTRTDNSIPRLEINGQQIPSALGVALRGIGGLNDANIIRVLQKGGTAVKNAQGQVVGAVSGGIVKTYSGQSMFNPLSKPNSKNKRDTSPKKPPKTILTTTSQTSTGRRVTKQNSDSSNLPTPIQVTNKGGAAPNNYSRSLLGELNV